MSSSSCQSQGTILSRMNRRVSRREVSKCGGRQGGKSFIPCSKIGGGGAQQLRSEASSARRAGRSPAAALLQLAAPRLPPRTTVWADGPRSQVRFENCCAVRVEPQV
jgi:hypothetical protein